MLKENESDPKVLTQKLNQILELKLYEMNKTLLGQKKAFISSFNVQDQPKNILDESILPNVKKNFNIDYNEENDRIEISSKFNVSEE